MVFEFVEDNLENLIDRHIKAGTHIPEIQVKVAVFSLRITCTSYSMGSSGSTKRK